MDPDIVQIRSGTGSDDDTPMPMKQDSRQLQLILLDQRFPMSTSSPENSRERHLKELKEFWKQYIRMPLSGSGMLSSEGVMPIGNSGSKIGTGTGFRKGPRSGYRRPRGTSLPTVKTPIMEKDNILSLTSTASNMDVGSMATAFAYKLHGIPKMEGMTLSMGMEDLRLL